ncbi:MAG: hypothetical protein JXA67_03015, partial [Micromonosporaceae bacterium]|nr:hypothetical protein [Micromonosporaceae bacterium]
MILIRGSSSLTCGLDEQVMAAAGRLLPDGEAHVEWYARDPAHLAACRLDRAVERVARMFGGLAQGAVLARVRSAILDPRTCAARYPLSDSVCRMPGTSSFALNVLCDALCEVGAEYGIDWTAARQQVVAALSDLHETLFVEAGGTSILPLGSGMDPWLSIDELDLTTAGPVDQLAIEAADHLNVVM